MDRSQAVGGIQTCLGTLTTRICLDDGGEPVRIKIVATMMHSSKCENGLAAPSKADPACPTGGALALLGNQTLPSVRECGFAKLPAILIGLAVAVALAVLFLVFSNAVPGPIISTPEVVETVDLEGTRAKAEQGDPDAQKNLGRIYAKGDVVKQDYKEAAKWYRLAADQGHAGAQAALGELYEAGQGVPHDDSEAAKWYRQAAEKGNSTAQYSLAVLCVMGKGVPRNIAEAVKWYRQAADQGDKLAQYNLGMRYYEANGVPADPVEAYQWLSLAATGGGPEAAKARDDLKRTLTREQLAEGRRRVEAFVIKKLSPPAK